MDFFDKVGVAVDQTSKLIDDNSIKVDELDCMILSLQRLLSTVRKADGVGVNLNSNVCELITDALTKGQVTISRVADGAKELSGPTAKASKAVEKFFKTDHSVLAYPEFLDSQESRRSLHSLILEHLYRSGYDDVAKVFQGESGTDMDADIVAPFLEMQHILGCIRNDSLLEVEQWISQSVGELARISSTLPNYVYRELFLRAVENSPPNVLEAVEYVRKLARCGDVALGEIHSLLGSLSYIHKGIENSPYAESVTHVSNASISSAFVREICTLQGLCADSPLSICVNAGCRCIGKLHYVRQVICSTMDGSNKNDLPVELNLGPAFQFHRVFTCPIMRAQCTPSNPPVRLECGHCISREAVYKLALGSRLKCPYCPAEFSASRHTPIIFG